MTREEAIKNLEMIRVAFIEPVTKEQGKLIDDSIDMAKVALEQEPKTGHWIFKRTAFDKFGSTVECSSCHKKWKTYDEIRWKKENKFCPHCGADMRSDKNADSN